MNNNAIMSEANTEAIDQIQVAKRYPIARMISGLYKFLGGSLIAFGIVSAFIYAKIGLFTLIGGVVGGVTLLAISEGIKIFIDIEENTRMAAERAKGIRL